MEEVWTEEEQNIICKRLKKGGGAFEERVYKKK